MSECKPVATPIDTSLKLRKNENQTEEDAKLSYRELVGALTYLSTTTRPDIAFVASHLGQFNNSYGVEHWKTAKRALRYLQGSSNIGLKYGSEPGAIRGFVDTD